MEPDGTIDPVRADREWNANTDLSRAPGYVVARASVSADTGGDTPPDNRQPVGDPPRARPGGSAPGSDDTELGEAWVALLAKAKAAPGLDAVDQADLDLIFYRAVAEHCPSFPNPLPRPEFLDW